ncbi:DNA mismatch repair protein MutS [Candidatus Peregrinibacteria bacterium]|nr:DNA mismatch repair protein MutS [Candidatus Peregrinibacteria bacterium]
MSLTPMMKQYFEIKSRNPDTILFFRLGDFYEMFDQDALIASEILGIALTSRNKGEGKIPMCGIPFHAAANYISKLTKAGKKVAICEQMSDPNLPGIVKRDVVKTITPGTTLDDGFLEQKKANYLGSIDQRDSQYSFCGVDLSTGKICVISVDSKAELINILEKYKPIEIIASNDFLTSKTGESVQEIYQQSHFFEYEYPGESSKICEDHFGILEFNRFNFEQSDLRINSLARVIDYLKETQKSSLDHLKTLQVINAEEFMPLDESTIKNLELTESSREKTVEGSLLGILDKTVTNAGGRLLRKMLLEPLVNRASIEDRLSVVDYFLSNQDLLLDSRLTLKNVADVERMISKLTLNSGNARDLRGFVNSFRAIKELKGLFNEKMESDYLKVILDKISLLPDLVEEIDRAIVNEPPISTKDGNMITDGFDHDLDYYKNISKDAKGVINSIQAREIERTGINSLKVKFNKVFGYYIEVSKSNLKQVPEDYERKQTLVNAERFSTQELKEYEEKILGAEEKIIALENKIFIDLCELVLKNVETIKNTVNAVASIDVFANFALVSWENKYVKPELSEEYNLEIIGGRHPVIEKLNPTDSFISNDLKLTDEQFLTLITGPNMGGKSTFLRQTALIVLMAHLGIFVPAKSAKIPIVDRIFTRVGASDNLVKGQSTFWVEMEEAALILNKATEKSLIILDEIGRGTSTFDGLSIAWGIMEYLHQKTKAKTLFASHYHELINLATSLANAKNCSVMVEEKSNEIIFLYKIAEGGVDRSYGIEVAKLAGLPNEIIERSQEILEELEAEKIGSGQQKLLLDLPERKPRKIIQNNLLEEKIKQIDLNNLTPREAMNLLFDLQKISKHDKQN